MHQLIFFINSTKTKEIVVSFNKTYGIYNYLPINGNPIEPVDNFKYLGAFVDSNLKRQSKTDYIYMASYNKALQNGPA